VVPEATLSIFPDSPAYAFISKMEVRFNKRRSRQALFVPFYTKKIKGVLYDLSIDECKDS
jgi:hypothetical protein